MQDDTIDVKQVGLHCIKKGRKLDKERFTTIHVHKKFNVPNWGRDKSLITRNIQFNKRKANVQSKKKI
ncbi:uncharacterized protein OCT59_022202 [Rhizophagus irregularis]|uniref:uncharacterized protein n=1 Tax=Rhizophagus irregularis TaxID=588596 RepID=UPI0019E28AC7|nr:hypothetical protein OCT59_022202 [Rhizophagus irregularis]GET56289.1 hypothetical protein GLOIN_2v1766400 [Rhizophagus irregularis DAOM 181602=DAOM 197198]